LHACFARLLAEIGYHSRALEQVDYAIAVCPVRGRTLDASLHATRAMVAHDRGHWDDAVRGYDEAVACYAMPTAPIAAYLAFVRAVASLQSGRLDEARGAFRAARKLDNAGMIQIKPLVALGDWVVEAIAPPAVTIDDAVVGSTYRLIRLLVARERGDDVTTEMREAQLAHEPIARWSVVSRAIQRLTELPFPVGRTVRDALLVGDGGRWFAPPGGRIVSIAHRPLLQRMLHALAMARLKNPGARLTIEQIAASLWPGERMGEQARKNRVYVAVSSLRMFGIGAMLDGTTSGYRLTPDVDCELR
jgi:hypothetical protein